MAEPAASPAESTGRLRPREFLPQRATFVVWAQAHRGTRSTWLARELGIEDVRFLASPGRGLGRAPFNYPGQLFRTVALLVRKRPRLVFVQSPPSFAAWVVALYCAFTRAAFVVDAHSDAFERARWTRPAWLNRLVARQAVTTIVTNDHWAGIVRSWGGEAMNIPAIPTSLTVGEPPPLEPGLNVTVVNSWSRDEPIDAVLSAARALPEVSFYVTGPRAGVGRLTRSIPPNVRFTGLLDQTSYNGLLARCDAVLCLTTHDNTMQNGACEALIVGTPIVTSDWPILRRYFEGAAVYVDNTPRGIVDGVGRLMADSHSYRQEIRQVRARRHEEWEQMQRTLLGRIRDRSARRSPNQLG